MSGPIDARHPSRALLRTQSDARLVELASAGHEAAFEAIVDRYGGALRAFCRRLVPDGREEDVVQQTFLNVHRALAAGRTDIELRPWLYAVARNAAFDALRAGAGRDDEPLDGVERPGATTEDTVLGRARLADAVAGVRALPLRQREALVLHELEGLTQQQVAELLGVSPGGVRQLVHRARGTLRRGVGAILPLPLLERLLAPASAQAAGANGGAAAGGGVLSGGAAVFAGKAAVAVVVAGVAVAVGKAPAPEAASVDERRGVVERRVVAVATNVGVSDLLATVPVTRDGRGPTVQRDADRMPARSVETPQHAAAPGEREDASRVPAPGTDTDARRAEAEPAKPRRLVPAVGERDDERSGERGPPEDRETVERDGEDKTEELEDAAVEAVERGDVIAPEDRDEAEDDVRAPEPADAAEADVDD